MIAGMDMTLVLASGGADVLLDWGVSIAIGACAFLLVVGLCRQRGQVALSPQREAAIATGHTDRKTAFERPVLGQLLWILLAVSGSVALPGLKKWIRRRLVASGNPEYYTPEEYLAKGMLTGIVLAVLLEIAYFAWTEYLDLLIPVFGFAFGFMLEIVQLHSRAAKRTRLIWKRVPYALDLISLAMGAGATFTEAVRAITRERRDEVALGEEDPFTVELRAMLAEMDLGTTRRQALRNLSDRVPLDSLQSIVASIIQAEELGTPLSDVLHDQATLLRQQRTVRAENAAASASVKILVPCLLLVMAVILTIFGPLVIRYMRSGGLF